MRTEPRDTPALGKAVLLACILGGCNTLPNPLYEATRPSHDRQCLDALAHVKECDPRFPDRTELCSYSAGDCQPYINAEQGQCLRQSACDAVRGALDRGDWLCGVSVHDLHESRP